MSTRVLRAAQATQIEDEAIRHVDSDEDIIIDNQDDQEQTPEVTPDLAPNVGGNPKDPGDLPGDNPGDDPGNDPSNDDNDNNEAHSSSHDHYSLPQPVNANPSYATLLSAIAEGKGSRGTDVSAPSKLSGSDRSKFRTFIAQWRLVFRANPNKFNNNTKKVIYACLNLEGIAFSWYENFLEIDDEPIVIQLTQGVSV